jgi:hypothetical protein
MDGYQKLYDKNKNVTKMGVIIKGVYYILKKIAKQNDFYNA